MEAPETEIPRTEQVRHDVAPTTPPKAAAPMPETFPPGFSAGPGTPPSGTTTGTSPGRAKKGKGKGRFRSVPGTSGYVPEPETVTLSDRYQHVSAGSRGRSASRRSVSRPGQRLSQPPIPEAPEDDENMGFEPEEEETLRRADERFQLWRMFEDRHHPTPKGRGRSRAATGCRDPNLPRPKATTATTEADPKFHECTRWEAFKLLNNTRVA